MTKGFRLFVILVALGVAAAPAEAQQPAKVPRIGFQVPPFPLALAASRDSGRVCATSGTLRGKTLPLSGDLERENAIVSPRSRPN